MSGPRLISPLLDNYVMGEPISEKMGICCCPALERDSENKYIVKVISTPTSQSQLDALLLSGAYPDSQSALQYFKRIADGIIGEANVLQRLSQLEGFLPYANWQLEPMDDGVGYDVYTLSEYRKTLSKLLRSENMTHLSAVNLGLDLCTALAVCRRIGYLYVDLKPENIYLADNNTWKIGEIGFVSLDSLKYASLPERYRSEYTAPEINDAFASLNTTLDVYALGLVLYKIYNANQLPANWGNPNNEHFLPPDYADYEMSEIILKACDPDPGKRWSDPIEMGQALVSYMQRNEVNDTPIIPTVITIEPAISKASEEEIADAIQESTEIPQLEDSTEADPNLICENVDENLDEETDESTNDDQISDAENLATLLTPADDETLPEQNEDQLDEIPVSDEVLSMVAQADDLIAHPAPSITSLEEIEQNDDCECVTIADTEESENTNNALEDADSPTEDAVSSDETASTTNTDALDEPTQAEEATETPVYAESPVEVEDAAPETLQNEIQPTEISIEQDDENLPIEEDLGSSDLVVAKKSHWIRNLLIGSAVIILALLAFLFYKKYYIQPIEALSVVTSPNGSATVNISTQADESKLIVICADAYGNTKTSTVKNGSAFFDELTPGTAYTVKLEVNGFHSLTGKTSAAFTSPAQIQIVQFDAITGNEDGSVILSFITKGQDSDKWSVTYLLDDGTQAIEHFSGHSLTIKGLTIGNTYTFQLTPEDSIDYVGSTEVSYTAAKVITPSNLQITSIADGKLTASWSCPDGQIVESWTVRCYGDKGFEQTSTVTEPLVIFDGIDTTEAYTLEVAAAGMSATTRISIPANAIVINSLKAEEDGRNLVVSWEAAQTTHSPLILSYTIDGSEPHEAPCNDSNRIVLKNYIPNATYAFQLRTEDGASLIGSSISYRTEVAENFSGFHVKASDMRFYPCRTPKKSNWSKKDLKASDYTSTFNSGEKVSFLVEVKVTYNPSKTPVTTMFVIHDEDGKLVDYSTSTRTWVQMWYKGLCELDVPSVPTESGKYTISIYMNGMLAGQESITIK